MYGSPVYPLLTPRNCSPCGLSIRGVAMLSVDIRYLTSDRMSKLQQTTGTKHTFDAKLLFVNAYDDLRMGCLSGISQL